MTTDLPEQPENSPSEPEGSQAGGQASAPAGQSRPGRNRRWLAVALGALTGVLVLVVVCGVWVFLDALRARDALQEVADGLPQLTEQAGRDPSAAVAAIPGIQDAARRAANATGGVHWAVVDTIPWVGDNTRALQTITEAVDDVATTVLPAATAALTVITPEQLAPKDGQLNLDPLIALRDPVAAANATLEESITRIGAIPRASLVTQLADAANQLDGQLVRAHELTSTADTAVRLLPEMLGAEKPRDWLVIAQNNAELRATGGIPGAVILIRADAGRLSIVEQRSAPDNELSSTPVLPLTPAEESLFSSRLGRFLQDANLTPDFPRTAELVRAMWQATDGEATGGEPAQNVLSIDPVAIQALLAATGPVHVTDPFGDTVTITSENAARFLLSEVYARYTDEKVQDVVFALAAQATLTQLMSGGTDPAALLPALTKAIEQGRLLVWSADPAEQSLLERAGVAGRLQGQTDVDGETAPLVGVFLNLTTASKMGYYLHTTADLTELQTNPDGSRELTLTVRLRSTITPGKAAKLPSRVLGNSPADGTNRLNLLVYAPLGGTVSEVNEPGPGTVTWHDDLQVSAQSVAVPAGKTVEVSWHITTGTDQPGPAQVRLTPGAHAS